VRYLTILLILACRDQGPCETRIIEAEFGPLYTFQVESVARYEEIGWDCVGESIRNAFGNSIGTKYTCTKC
jgi:hypothetical protein